MTIYLNPLIFYESKLKIKTTSLWTFGHLNYVKVSSYLQSLLNENEIVQLLHNYKCYGVDQSRFRKPLQSSIKNVKNNYLKTTRSFLPVVKFVASLNA